MHFEKHTVNLTTATGGAAIGYTPVVTGRIINVIYNKDATTPFSDGVDFAITSESTGQTLWAEENVNASKTVAPRQATHSTAGVAALYAAAGTAVNDYVCLANDRVKIAVASGGDAKLGSFTVVVG